ncbi:MAG: hypothetical protein ACLPR9_10265 [Acidimicrobiales bacterium]|jgi:hypothetical protein
MTDTTLDALVGAVVGRPLDATEALKLELARLDAITTRWWSVLTDDDDLVADPWSPSIQNVG